MKESQFCGRHCLDDLVVPVIVIVPVPRHVADEHGADSAVGAGAGAGVWAGPGHPGLGPPPGGEEGLPADVCVGLRG